MKRARFEASQTSPPQDVAEYQPKISRKIRACQACQNRKIKCNLDPGENRCARCARLGLTCVVNKSLQTLLDDENEWKTDMEARMQSLQAALIEVQRTMNMPQLLAMQQSPVDGSSFCQSPGVARAAAQSHPSGPTAVQPTGMTRENSAEAETQDADDQAIVNPPMASLFEVTKLRNIRNDPWTRLRRPPSRAQQPDFIDQGKFGAQEAEQLFTEFEETFNAYLWGGITLVHNTLAATRASSTLLTAAILAVTALHAQDEGRAFDTCYPIFIELVGQAMFDRYHTLDDIRGLCIGAFWLSDLSWKLSGLAVRIATELDLHQFCAKALRDGPQYIEEARLWYLLYVCDHHFSIAYGRPPVINENSTITSHENLFQLQGITEADFRLHSQVGVFVILSRVFHTFGPDRSRMIGSDEFEILRRFDVDLGHWRKHWETRLAPNKYVAHYPAKGVILHYHFARLQLFSICLRGLRPSEQYSMSPERRHFVNLAISSASAALSLILNDGDMRKAVIGVPLYLHTTIAYACLFLMKAQSQWRSANLAIRYEDVVALIEGTISLLEETRRCVRHVAHFLGRGLNTMLQKFKERSANDEAYDQAGQAVPQTWTEAEMLPDWNSWMFGGLPNQFGLDSESYGLNFLDVLNSQMPG
ncbi:Fungal specific transcription factor, putative [Tolypocladium paradoxum]|uniref:Fungal specific transcription factor, putative n=1 Tax=Tolypocladium paradoxum TaxID=94208 RepID=A0A2S4L1U0_9HYPO|nr:Fungal specific transcription factor, putative [Tolypocladium paradoxum]